MATLPQAKRQYCGEPARVWQNNISLRVWDDGPGVSETIREHLFEPFNTSEAEGTGLGLYVARELAHANNGDLCYVPHAKSFELILPRAPK